jgi:2-oxoglutarate dehydrogenase E2 component (dihydrolipoamide succinyltransferase)
MGRLLNAHMPQLEILLPKMGESVAEATIIKWLKNEGDTVLADEAMVEIATDKVDSEVPAPQDGDAMVKRLVNDGDVVKVGQPIAHIGHGGGCFKSPPARTASGLLHPRELPTSGTAAPSPCALSHAPFRWRAPRWRVTVPVASSTARWCATSRRAKAWAWMSWTRIPGTGEGGRVTKKDLLDYLPTTRCRTGLPTATQPFTSAPLHAAIQATA